MKKLLLVVNPYSGQKKAAKLLPEIIAMFNRADYTVQVYITAGPGDATVEVARVCRDVDLVVCCGGDGTFNETLAGILESGCLALTSNSGAFPRLNSQCLSLLFCYGPYFC